MRRLDDIVVVLLRGAQLDELVLDRGGRFLNILSRSINNSSDEDYLNILSSVKTLASKVLQVLLVNLADEAIRSTHRYATWVLVPLTCSMCWQ